MFNSIISQLLVWSLQIKNQTQKYGNTETLVGGLFEKIITLIKSIADYISNIIFGFIRQPGVDTYNDTSDGKTSLLNSYPAPEKGWTVLVRNDETNGGVATLYQWNGTAWINLETVVYNDDIVTQDNFIPVKSSISFTPAFPFSSATNQTSNLNYIWCNDYPATSVSGIEIKVKTGTMNIYKFNFITKKYSLIKTVGTISANHGTTQQIMFDSAITLDIYERIGINGDVFFSNDTNLTLYPNVRTYNLITGEVVYQKDITFPYNLITSDASRVQNNSNAIEKLKYDLNTGYSVAPILPTLTSSYGTGGNTVVTTCNLLKSNYSGTLTEITAKVRANIDNVIILFSIVDNKAYEKNRFIINTPVDGAATISVNSRINRGDFLGFFIDTTKFNYRTASPTGLDGSKFMQIAIPNDPYAGTFMNGWVGLSYKVKPDVSIETEIINNGYESGNFHCGNTSTRKSYATFSSGKWVTFNNDIFSYEGTIKKIIVDLQTSGDLTLGIGLIDQRGWAIIDNEVTINCPNAGINEVSTNITLPENKRLFIKSPVNIGLSNGGFHLETQENSIILNPVSDELIFRYEIEGKRFVSTNLATKTETEQISNNLAEISSTVNNLTFDVRYRQSPDGSYWESTIDNNGVETWVRVTGKKIVVLGNSIERHPITSYWWGDWGMAASTRKNDWTHKLVTKLRANNILATAFVQNIVDWETQGPTFDYSTLDNILTGADLVIIRIGENNPNSATLTADTEYLIDYIRSKVSNVPIIFGGVFWTNAAKQAKLKAAVDLYPDIPFIDFQVLDKPENKSAVGNLVYGDDGQWHTINNTSVANHAGDLGQDKMSDMILPYSVDFMT